jgi:hypothetical protein
MSKVGSALLRTAFIRAANHLEAPCVVAGHLAERFWVGMTRGVPYVICDTDGTPVATDEGKTIIVEQWTVPADARARRRSREKAGKALSKPRGHVRSDARRRRQTRRPSPLIIDEADPLPTQARTRLDG